MLKHSRLKALLILGLLPACSDSTKFQGTPESGSAPKAADVIPEPTPKPKPKPSPSLDVTLPAHEIRSGLRTLQATAEVENAEETAVIWSVTGPDGHAIGHINQQGVYTSPEELGEEINVVITATLASDSKVFDSETVRVVPRASIFVGCSAGSEVFPIKAEVFRLPVDTQRLPDFSTIGADKISTVCMDQYDVPQRSFNEGFPGVEGLNEWFALHTSGKLIVPAAGDYVFRLISDDGSILSIGGTKVVDNDGLHSTEAREGSIALTPGVHDFALDYYQGPADQIALQLYWQVPGSSEFVIVPSSAFLK